MCMKLDNSKGKEFTDIFFMGLTCYKEAALFPKKT